MKNLSIGKKLLVTFVSIMLVFLITIIVALGGMLYGGSQFKDFYQYTYPMSTKTLDTRRGLQMSIKALGLSMLTDDNNLTDSYIAEADAQLQTVEDNLTYLQQNFRGDTTRINEALSKLDQAYDYRVQIVEHAKANRNQQAADIFFNQYDPIMLEITNITIAMDENTDALATTTYSNSYHTQILVTILSALISVGAIIITILLALYITRSLTKPVFEIENAAKELSDGNLNVDISYISKDELGILAESMRKLITMQKTIIGDISSLTSAMAEGNFAISTAAEQSYVGNYKNILLSLRKMNRKLSDTLNQITMSSEQVDSGSDQVASAAQALSQGAAEQASSIEELASTIEEISNQVAQTAANADEANARTIESENEVTECNRQMQDMISAMSEISQKSGEIGKIIKTIEDIAFQTNILALNAAVEAARAGEAGKGFAVVADEVRNLASKSAEASKNTSVLIEATVSAVDHGTKLANDTAQSLINVVEKSKNAAEVVDKIAAAAGEQAKSVNMVTQGIEQISSVVQTNSATAEQSAAASEELSSQAQILKDLVEQFQLRENNNVASISAGSTPALS